MTNLSPQAQAQAIVDAFNGYHEMVNRRVKIAAALRALVFQLQYYQCCEEEGVVDMVLDSRAILDVADELEVL